MCIHACGCCLCVSLLKCARELVCVCVCIHGY